MKTLELTEEQCDMLAIAILAMIRNASDNLKSEWFSSAELNNRYREMRAEDMMRWQTLLNYINS